MNKQICLITGATEGIGKVTAMELAKKGFTVVLAARSEAKAKMVKDEITAFSGRTDTDYIVADLRSLRQIHQLAETFKRRYGTLDVLINNAGIFMPTRTVTEDGYETTYQVNYLSHFFLTHLLLGELNRSEQGRIINLSSSVYTMGKFDVDNLQSEKQFSVMAAYSSSKLFMLMYSIELANRLRETRITVNALHPGIVRTQMMLGAPGLFKVISYLALPFSISTQRGAETSVYLATSPNASGLCGKYFVNSRVTKVNTKFNTIENRELLWNISMNSLRPFESVSR
jgi:retinol dehydrogenase-12